jgi:hypothetical protein
MDISEAPMSTINAGEKQGRHESGRFQPGQSGNPAGMPKGTRHRATRLAEQLFDGEADGLVRKAIELALAGDGVALRLCLDRLVPPRRDRPVRFKLPPLTSTADAVAAMAAIVAAVAAGDLTPDEASQLSGLVANTVKTIQATELERRVRALEEKT